MFLDYFYQIVFLMNQLLKKINYNGIFILQTARKKEGFEKETIKEYLDFIGKYLQR